MKNYVMTITYDGTAYCGWQKQHNAQNSIQGKIEAVLSKMCGEPVSVHGSGRTDAGVHAKGQVASFKCSTEKTPLEIKKYLNLYLPKDIAVKALDEADERFHARLSAKRKTYLYRINISGISNVFERKYIYDLSGELDIEKMKKAAEKLLGKHDFKAFSSVKRTKKSTVREIYAIEVEKLDGEIDVSVTGNGFLYNMVRIIVGTLIEAGRGERTPESVEETLLSLDRETAGYTAPPEGLVLVKVEY